jgi:hypothetical protein
VVIGCNLGNVQVRGGVLLVNGQPQEEPFINERPAYVLNKLTVPPGDVSGPQGAVMQSFF